MRITVRTKIILITVAILLLTVGATTGASAYLLHNVFADVAKAQVSIMAASLVSKLERLMGMGIPLGELVGFEEQCREIRIKHPEIAYAMVADPAGTILFHDDPSRHGRVIAEPSRLGAIQSRLEHRQLIDVGEKRYYEAILPVIDDKEKLAGAVIVGFPTSVVAGHTRRLVGYSILVAGISFAFAAILLVFALSAWIGKPVVRLLEAIHAVRHAPDGLSTRVAVDANDEIGDLADAFNQMTENLQRTTVTQAYMDKVFAGMMDTLMVVDPDGVIRTVNKSLCDLLGYAEDELLGKSMDKVLITDAAIKGGRDLCKQVAQEMLKEQVVYYRAKDNAPIPVFFGGSAMRDNAGRLTRMICTGRDITERVRAEAALRESEDRYRDLVEFSDYIICTHDLQGRILSVNKRAAECLDYDWATLQTMNIRDVLATDTRHLLDGYLEQMKKDRSARGLMRMKTRTGATRIWEYANTLRTEGVPFPIIRAMAHDITQKRAAEKERERFVQELQAALNKVKTLSGLLPICSYCHKIRDDQGYWKRLEAFIQDHSDAAFSHSICRECAETHYSDYDLYGE